MAVRGIRGATVASQDKPESILAATKELLLALMEANPDLQTHDLASIMFTMTDDLRSIFPAQAARQLGWDQVPLMCCQEILVPDDLPRCIRVLIHWNTEKAQSEIHHVYLKEASRLRPDISMSGDHVQPGRYAS
jgi:chorismate mutase